MALELREFGQTGLKIPPLVFGTTSLGNLFGVVDEIEKSAIVESWFRSGLTPVVIDSAGKYGAGLSLEVIGRELDRLKIPEDKYVLSNKLAWRRSPLRGKEPTFEPGAWFGLEHDAIQDISYDGIMRCWHEGTRLLGGRSAQLVSVHDPDEYLAAAADASDRSRRLENLIGAYNALKELKESGQVVALGVGAKDWRSILELSKHCEFDWVMIANSFTLMQHPRDLLHFMERLHQNNIAIINSALFHGGFLVGGEFFDYRRIDPANPLDEQRLRWRSKFHDVCRLFRVSPFHVGVAFGLAHPAVTAVALSSSRADRVASHIDALARSVPVDIWAELKKQELLEESCDFVS